MTFDPSDLRTALERDEIFPEFQPVVEMRTGQIAGFEVLARWIHPHLGGIPPDRFIPVAEGSGLIGALTERILKASFSASSLNRTSAAVAVNVSPIQLKDFHLPEMIARLAQSCGFSLDRLIIELTESALLDDPQTAIAVAAELKTLGCRLALDDFGTGYSSLRHLNALPFDALKVDRSFVSTMSVERHSRKIVASVIGLGQSLGLVTVAEGVETREQAEMLLWMGCDLGQGWLYGKPAPDARLDDTVRQTTLSVSAGTRMSDESMSLDGPPIYRLAQLQAIYDGAPVGLCLLDRNLQYISINRQLADYNQVPALSHLGRSPADVIPHVFLQVESYMRRALQGEAIYGVEIHKPSALPDAEPQILLGSYQPVRDEAGEVIGISVAVMDITERKRMEKILRDVEDHSRSLIELIPHVPWVLNPRGEVIEASPRWETITGQPLSQAMGNGWLQVLHPDDVSAAVEAVRVSLATGGSIDVRYRVRNSSGAWLWMRSRGAPRLSDSGQIMAVYGIVEEIENPHPMPHPVSH